MRDVYTHKSPIGGRKGGRKFVVKELTYIQRAMDVFDLGEQAPFVPQGGLSMLQPMSNGSAYYMYDA